MKEYFTKNHRYVLVGSFIISIVLIFYFFFANLAFPESSYNFDISGQTKLYPELAVIQMFTAKEANLSQLKITLKNSDLDFGEKIVFDLADENCSQVLARDTIKRLAPLGMFYRFNFEKIKDSKGKKYCLRATFYSNRKSDFPEISISEDETFKESSFMNSAKNKTYEERTLVFRPAYESDSLQRNLERMSQRISQYKPEFLKSYYLTFISFIFIFLSIFLVVILILI